MDDVKKSFSITIYLRQHRRALLISIQQLIKRPSISLFTALLIGWMQLPIFFYMTSAGFNQLSQFLQSNLQISVYLKKNLPVSQTNFILNQLKQSKNIKEVKFISSEEGLKEFMQAADIKNIDKQLNDNPLPAVLILKLKWLTLSELKHLAADLEHHPYVQAVEYDKKWISWSYGIMKILQQTKLWGGLLLCFGIITILGISLQAVLKEYIGNNNLYHLLGANKAFVRRPMLYLGLVFSLLASILSVCFVFMLGKWLGAFLSFSWQLTPEYNLQLFEFSFKNYFFFFVIALFLGWFSALIFSFLPKNLEAV